MQASLELQRALVEALSSDSALNARALKIYDGPPADARPPYLSVGADVVSDRGWKGGGGYEHRFSVTLWDARDGLAAAKAVMADVERIVLGMPRQVGGYRLLTLRLLRATVRRSPRNWTQAVSEFRALSVMDS